MPNFEKQFEQKTRTSIFERQEIIAPPNFVSVFHETKAEFLPGIDQNGLMSSMENRNVGKADVMARRNAAMDKYRPAELIAKGISRANIYGYPFLQYGNGLFGADMRFVKKDQAELLAEFESMNKYNPKYIQELGVTTAEEYISAVTSPEYLRKNYPGEVIEMKVDPQKCYVGDLEYINRIMDDLRYFTEDEAIERQAQEYWSHLITLSDFLQWYKKPEWEADGNSYKDIDSYRDGEPISLANYFPIKGAPANFSEIHYPEVLIPENVPQEYIRLLND